MLVLAGFLFAPPQRFERLNLFLYDLILPVQSPAMSDQLVIVTVDDASIAELGRWPWSRARHAQLVDRLTEHGPQAIGFDILFTESQDDRSDGLLATALERNGRTVLAVAPAQPSPGGPISELLPMPDLAISAAALGHVDAELDVDGQSRQFFLYAGLDDPRWPGLGLAMMNVAGAERGQFGISVAAKTQGLGWIRAGRGLIPYAAINDPPKRLSYADVLAGRVAANAIRDKFVLVGVVATGLGDVISTPVSRLHERTPGVEVIAHVLNGLLQNVPLRHASAELQFLLSVALVASGTLMVLLLPLRLGFFAMLAAVALTLGSSAALLALERIWFAPAAALVLLPLGWALWSVWLYGIEESRTRLLMRRLEHQTRHHIITGFPNQGVLEGQLCKLGDKGPDGTLAVLLVLKVSWHESASVLLNRTVGDQLLRMLAERLRTVAPEGAFLAHLNGDDFAVLLNNQLNFEHINDTAATLLEALKQPLMHENSEIMLVPHMGGSVWPTDGRDGSALLRNAYTAMFQSRLEGLEGLCFYSADIGKKLEVRAQLEQALVHALQRDEFLLYYQPQVDAITHQIIGVEALIRWKNPELGWISPAEFIPVAEHTGLINVIGNWVLETACRDLTRLKDAGLRPLRMAVNLSPLQFTSSDLVFSVQDAMRRFGVPPDRMELEVTESTVMNNLDNAVKAMHELRALGIELAIDDFGTGYSSLSSLRSFPVDRLKIDQSFIREIGHSDAATGIVLTILSMARRLGLGVIAEGVETAEQAEFLRKHECEELQGYLFSRPIPVEELAQLLGGTLIDVTAESVV